MLAKNKTGPKPKGYVESKIYTTPRTKQSIKDEAARLSVIMGKKVTMGDVVTMKMEGE